MVGNQLRLSELSYFSEKFNSAEEVGVPLTTQRFADIPAVCIFV